MGCQDGLLYGLLAQAAGARVWDYKGEERERNEMSLDVCLTTPEVCPHCGGKLTTGEEIYWRNITHNLNSMADEAGIYKCLWRPDEIGIKKASQMIEPLRAGLTLLKGDPGRFKKFNPPNGWGDYDGLVEFVTDYLAACEANPDADVHVSR